MNNQKILSGKISSVLIGVLVCIFWGSNYPLIKMSYDAFSVESTNIPSIMLMAGLRFVISGLVLIFMTTAKEKKVRLPDKSNVWLILVLSFVSTVMHYTFMYSGIAFCESSKSSILKQIGFLFISCFAFLFVKEDKFTFGKLFGGILGFAGIVSVNMNGLDFSFGFGETMILMASICSVLGTVIGKHVFKHHDPIYMTAYGQFIGGVMLTSIGLVIGGRFGGVSLKGILILGYICFSSVIAYSLWNMLVKYNDISKMSIIKYLEPVFGVVCSGIVLGEDIFNISYLVAFVMIIAAIICGNYKKRA